MTFWLYENLKQKDWSKISLKWATSFCLKSKVKIDNRWNWTQSYQRYIIWRRSFNDQSFKLSLAKKNNNRRCAKRTSITFKIWRIFYKIFSLTNSCWQIIKLRPCWRRIGVRKSHYFWRVRRRIDFRWKFL